MQDHCGDNSVSVLLLTMETLSMRMMMMVLTIPVIGVSNGMAGGVDLILTKAWRLPSKRRQWSIHYLGHTNTCGNRFGADRDGDNIEESNFLLQCSLQ